MLSLEAKCCVFIMLNIVIVNVVFFIVLLSAVMLNVEFFYCYAKFHYAECRYAKRHVF